MAIQNFGFWMHYYFPYELKKWNEFSYHQWSSPWSLIFAVTEEGVSTQICARVHNNTALEGDLWSLLISELWSQASPRPRSSLEMPTNASASVSRCIPSAPLVSQNNNHQNNNNKNNNIFQSSTTSCVTTASTITATCSIRTRPRAMSVDFFF